MPQAIPIAALATLALTTADSTNQVQGTYDYVNAGTLNLYARGSDATVLATLMVAGSQILRNIRVPWFGTSGALDTSAHYVGGGGTLGGRVELSFRASAGTPTVDYLLTYSGIPFANVLSRLAGRR